MPDNKKNNRDNRYRTGARPKSGGGGGPKPEASREGKKSRQRLFSDVSEDHCAVCLNRMQIFAVGMCNHPVCSECSTRMRILCDQKECPICRQDMPKVFHTENRHKYEEVENSVFLMDKRHKICFENGAVQKAHQRLLEHRCPVCVPDDVNRNGRTFPTFKHLDTHVRREHEKFYCDLCSDHLKIFSHERKLYTRQTLAVHRRKGDPDDRSHKGHPPCDFCQTRFVDNDELFRHLRRDHFFCHFCDADGKQLFYENYPDLQGHFRSDHFLCEEGDCKREKFTSAFRTEIDLKAHVVERHGEGLSKAAAKQQRTVDLDLSYSRTNNQINRRFGREDVNGSADRSSQNQADPLPEMSNENFPTLGGSAPVTGAGQGNMAGKLAMCAGQNVGAAKKWVSNGMKLSGPKILEEHFPSLTSTSDQTEVDPNWAAAKSRNKTQQKAGSVNKKSPVEDFPSLGSGTKGNSLLSNFTPAGSAQAYRYPTGYRQPWQTGGDDGNGAPPGMVPLTKSTRKAPAPPPDIPSFDDDRSYPSLVSEGGKFAEKKPKGEQKSSKKTKKSKPKEESGTKQPSNNNEVSNSLAAAADLITLGPKTNKLEPREHSQLLIKNQTNVKTDFKSSKSIKDEVKEKSDFTGREDFPSLGASGKKISAQFGRPLETSTSVPKAPPPGFGSNSKKKANAPPPGFEGRGPVGNRPAYLQPNDFNQRNKELLERITEAMGDNFGDFKNLSVGYLKTENIGSSEYHQKCLELLGLDTFEKVLPELLALLPDIQKQQELFAVHISKFPRSILKVTPCSRCGQILAKWELASHLERHQIDSDYPTLS